MNFPQRRQDAKAKDFAAENVTQSPMTVSNTESTADTKLRRSRFQRLQRRNQPVLVSELEIEIHPGVHLIAG